MTYPTATSATVMTTAASGRSALLFVATSTYPAAAFEGSKSVSAANPNPPGTRHLFVYQMRICIGTKCEFKLVRNANSDLYEMGT
jgi:hypothetical protein